MMTDTRKISAMHRYHGRRGWGKCGDCPHFRQGRYHDKMLFKCRAYGLTHSAASDWAKSWAACGLYDKPEEYVEGLVAVIKLARSHVVDNTPCDGQLEMI